MLKLFRSLSEAFRLNSGIIPTEMCLWDTEQEQLGHLLQKMGKGPNKFLLR